MPAPHMNVLGVDTSLDVCSIALRIDGRLVAEQTDPHTKGHAEHLLPMVQRLLADQGLAARDLDALGVAIGPGLFTGVRVGIAAVRGLRLVLRIPAIGVGTLHAIALSALQDGAAAGQRILVANDARNDEAYVQSFTAAAAPEAMPELLAYPDVIARAAPGMIVLGTAAPLFVARGDVAVVPGYARARAQEVAAIAEAAVRAPDFRDAGPPRPLYVRAPHARTMDGTT